MVTRRKFLANGLIAAGSAALLAPVPCSAKATELPLDTVELEERDGEVWVHNKSDKKITARVEWRERGDAIVTHYRQPILIGGDEQKLDKIYAPGGKKYDYKVVWVHPQG
jgi:hypothetical protein